MASGSEVEVARVHLLVSLSLFILAVGYLAVQGLSYATLLSATPLLVLGAFAVLIFGTSRMLIAGYTRGSLAGSGRLGWVVLALASAGATGTWAALALQGSSSRAGAWAALWTVAMLLHAGLVLATHKSMRQRSQAPGRESSSGWGPMMAGGGMLYGVAGGLALPVALAGALPLPAALHLLLPGFVMLVILGVATHVLLDLEEHLPGPLMAVMGIGALLGPGLVAWGLSGTPDALVAGALLELTAVFLFAVGLARRVLKGRQRRPSLPAYVAAVIFLLAGVGLGVHVAVHPASWVLVPVHATLNLLGFVGLVILGASADLYAPSLQPGLTPLRAHTWLVTGLAIAGVVLAALGAGPAPGAIARVGLILYLWALGLHLAGSWAAGRRSGAFRAASRRGLGASGKYP